MFQRTHIVRAILVGFCALLAPRPSIAEDVVYRNEFNDPPKTQYPEWSSSPITYFNHSTPKPGAMLAAPIVDNADSPNGKQRYLGPFGGPRLAENTPDFNRTRVQQTVHLKLAKLPSHQSVTVACDLYVLHSWDGNNPHYGPDRWQFSVEEGPTLLDTTFSNNPKTGAYDLSNQDYPKKDSKYQSNVTAINSLGSRFFGDAVYKLSYTFNHSADNLVLNFRSDLFEGKGTDDEGWGLDNVLVTTHKSTVKANASPKTPEKPQP